MRSLKAATSRRDPAPSRWGYRYQRLMLTPGFRKLVKVGVPLLVVGNKSDLVERNELESILEENKISFDFLSSAKTGNTVNELFLKMATLLRHDA